MKASCSGVEAWANSRLVPFESGKRPGPSAWVVCQIQDITNQSKGQALSSAKSSEDRFRGIRQRARAEQKPANNYKNAIHIKVLVNIFSMKGISTVLTGMDIRLVVGAQ